MFFQFFNSNIGYVCMRYLRPYHPVVTRLDTSVLPRNIFSQSYLLYVIAQGTDVGNVANKANEAGQGAYDAQVRNDEQDVILADHEQRISAAEATLVNHEERISQAESTLLVIHRDYLSLPRKIQRLLHRHNRRFLVLMISNATIWAI